MLIYCIQFYWTSTLLGLVISQFIYILVFTLNFLGKNKKANKQTNKKFKANQLPLTLRKLSFLKNMGSRFYSLWEGLVSYFYTLMLGPVSPVLGSRGPVVLVPLLHHAVTLSEINHSRCQTAIFDDAGMTSCSSMWIIIT